MLNEKLEKLRDLINTMIVSENYDPAELVKKSQELDELIVKVMREKYQLINQLEKREKNVTKDFFINTNIIERMYDSMRIVDPASRDVLDYKFNELKNTDIDFQKIWKEYDLCNDCAYLKAYFEKDTVFMLECLGNRTYVFIAVPVKVKDRQLVLEFFKEVKNNFYILNQNLGDTGILEFLNKNKDFLTIKDEDNGLHNIEFINNSFPFNLCRTELSKKIISIIIVKIQGIKQLINSSGPDEGYKIIKGISDKVNKQIRRGQDWAMRSDIDEFSICLDNCDYQIAVIVADRILKSIEERDYTIKDKENIVYDLKIYTTDTNEGDSLDYIINKARAEGIPLNR